MTSGSASRERRDGEPVAEERVAAGRIVAAHGLRGEVVVEVLSDVPDRFAAGASLLLTLPPATPRPVQIVAARPHKGRLLVRLGGVEDRDAAEALRGALLEVPRAAVPPAPEDGYYWFDLVGLSCGDRRLGELGTVAEVMEGGGGVLLRVEGRRGELLLPFVDAYLLAVDLPAGRIEWDLPEGLVEGGPVE
jgi:16S rRNA processing protein RimM